MELSKGIKTIASGLSVMAVLITAIYFIDDRYFKVADAKEMAIRIEKAAVDTFQKQQQYMDSKQKKLQMEMLIIQLDSLREYLRDVERRLEKNPTSIYLKNQLERLKNKIRRLEGKLYN